MVGDGRQGALLGLLGDVTEDLEHLVLEEGVLEDGLAIALERRVLDEFGLDLLFLVVLPAEGVPALFGILLVDPVLYHAGFELGRRRVLAHALVLGVRLEDERVVTPREFDVGDPVGVGCFVEVIVQLLEGQFERRVETIDVAGFLC